VADELARGLLVLHHVEAVARGGDAVEAEELDRSRGSDGLEGFALVVDDAADLAAVLVGDDDVAPVQRAGLDQYGGDRAAPIFKLSLSHFSRPYCENPS